MTNWGQLGLKLVNIAELGPTWLQVGFLWGQPGPKLGPTRAKNADSTRMPETRVFTAIYNTFWFRWGRSPRSACLGPNSDGKFLHTGPSCAC